MMSAKCRPYFDLNVFYGRLSRYLKVLSLKFKVVNNKVKSFCLFLSAFYNKGNVNYGHCLGKTKNQREERGREKRRRKGGRVENEERRRRGREKMRMDKRKKGEGQKESSEKGLEGNERVRRTS